jgi:hypothetical protein
MSLDGPNVSQSFSGFAYRGQIGGMPVNSLSLHAMIGGIRPGGFSFLAGSSADPYFVAGNFTIEFSFHRTPPAPVGARMRRSSRSASD